MAREAEEKSILEYRQHVAQIDAARELHRELGAVSMSAVEREPVPPCLVPEFLYESSIHVLNAATQSCKTWLALQTMLCGQHELPWLSGARVRPFDTLYLAADSPKWDIGGQLRKLRLGLGIGPAPESASRVLPFGFNTLNKAHVKTVDAYCEAFPSVRCLMIDVLLYAYLGANENDNGEMAQVYHSFKRLRDKRGLAIFLLHHNRKADNEARGAGTVIQAADFSYLMAKRPKSTTIDLIREKVRSDSEWDNLSLVLQRNEFGGRHLLQTENFESAPSTLHPILVQLAPGAELSRSLLLKALGSDFSEAWLDLHLAKLKQQNLIHQPRRGWYALRP